MGQPIRVLVVEDSSFMRKALVRRIEFDPRFSVVDTAGDGREGVEKALRLVPDVVTLDVEMPVLNGIEALKQIVSRSSIPVVMVSAVTEAGAKTTLEALAIGAIDFIPKSKGAELIHETLLAAVHARPARIRAPGPAIPPPPAPITPAPPRAPAAKPVALRRNDVRIAVVGSSTGGPQALHHVLKALPSGLRVPVVIAQHMPPQFTAALARHLNESCSLTVVEARDGDRLVPGKVFVAPGGFHMRVKEQSIEISGDQGESIYRPSVGVLALSALESFGPHVLGVMLTGMGNDGAREFQMMKQAGAHIIAQDQASCVVYGMPRAVAENGAADEVLALDAIGERIGALIG